MALQKGLDAMRYWREKFQERFENAVLQPVRRRKLTEAQERRIQRATRTSARVLAARYGVHHATILRIKAEAA